MISINVRSKEVNGKFTLDKEHLTNQSNEILNSQTNTHKVRRLFSKYIFPVAEIIMACLIVPAPYNIPVAIVLPFITRIISFIPAFFFIFKDCFVNIRESLSQDKKDYDFTVQIPNYTLWIPFSIHFILVIVLAALLFI